MPPADMANTIVIGAQTGHVRTTSCWILGRLLRDLDDRLDEEMRDEQLHIPPGCIEPPPSKNGKPWEALRISIFEVTDEPGHIHGIPHPDLVWFSGFLVIVVQLLVAIIPWVVNREWGTFLITATGNLLALVGASLPKWREEKWSCPKKGGATIILTQGNGSRHAIVILGKKGVGLDLEILAQGTRTAPPSRFTRAAASILAILWIGLLITAAGLQIHTWCRCPYFLSP